MDGWMDGAVACLAVACRLPLPLPFIVAVAVAPPPIVKKEGFVAVAFS